MSNYGAAENEEDLFNMLSKDIHMQNREKNAGRDLVEDIEKIYKGENKEYMERESRRRELKKSLAEKKKKLKSIKNPGKIGNPQRREIITKEINSRREKLRKEISAINVELDDIAIEAGEPIEAEKKEEIESVRKIKDKEKQKKELKKIPWLTETSSPYSYDTSIGFD